MNPSHFIIFIFFILTIFHDFDSAFGQECQTHSPIRIACTPNYGCPLEVKKAINMVAKKFNYKVKFLALHTKSTPLTPDKYDAIISPGGKDINVKYYQDFIQDQGLKKKTIDYYEKTKSQHTTPQSLMRDDYEYIFFKNYFSPSHSESEKFNKKPALGICYGSQMMGVVHGIPIIADMRLFLELPASYDKRDLINTNSNSLIAQELTHAGLKSKGPEQSSSYSFLASENHHQTLDVNYANRISDLHQSLLLIATSHHHKVVEGIHYLDRPALGIQFHPELFDQNNIDSKQVTEGIFGWLLVEACRHK
ncbi:MAG: gamma-glutamyl-gamma-aminobutyrate hydrolase family protein [Bacteriovoracaceae bacterium]|nr:gamma-glutamyl-gamma-aminobutyrate hydrolase family protein [Bacteriovoracaceae bacterium]